MNPSTKKYPVLVKIPIESSTHQDFEISSFGKYKEKLSIRKERNGYVCYLETYVTESSIESEIWRVIDSLCLSLSITQDGVFSRLVSSIKGALGGIEFLGAIPPTAPGTGINVLDVKNFELNFLPEAELFFKKFETETPHNENIYSLLIAYTVSCRFFNTQLIRESAINFFSVVEMVATLVLPPMIAAESVYKETDLHKAAKALGINNFSELDEAYDVRGELAHGHTKHLLLMQHSLGEQTISGWFIREPALKCKKAADMFLRKFLRL